MLFGKKICPNCQSGIDKAEPTCPVCGREFEAPESKPFSNKMTWLPWYKQLIVFFIGSAGLTIAATLLQLFVILFGQSETPYVAIWINFFGYFIAITSIGAVIWMHFKGIFKSFKHWLPYVMGIAGVAAIYTFNVVYNNVIALIYQIGNNANETAVDSFILGMPIVSFFIVVLFGPICEELTYRMGLFSFLSRVHVALGYVATAIIFAFIHFDWTCFGNSEVLINELLNIPLYMFAGLTFCFLYHKWGFASSLTAHIGNNLLSFTFVLLLGYLNE